MSIQETFCLPSKGKLYENINPSITLRSMTTMEEKKRLGSSTLPFKLLAEIITDCIVGKKEINAYDLVLGDFQYLLFKLRTVTYGSDYKLTSTCPYCGKSNDIIINLDELKLFEYQEKIEEQLRFKLPVSGKEIQIKLLTPRDLDRIDSRAKEILNKVKDYQGSPNYLLTLETIIDKVDNEKLIESKKEQFVQSLVLKDANLIQKTHDKIKLGVDTKCVTACPVCKMDYSFFLPFTGEFLGPSID